MLKLSNASNTDSPPDHCIHQLFEAQATRTPDAIALIFGDAQLTYAELNQRANRLAHLLRSVGVGPEVRVAICLERSLELIVGLLGILKAGGAYVPIDPTYPQERIGFMLEDTNPAVILTQTRLSGAFSSHTSETSVAARPRLICLDAARDLLDAQSAESLAPINADHLAYIMYTSGSTGRPKGVSVTHRNVVRLVHAPDYVDLRSSDSILQLAPITFDASTFEIWSSLLHGARLVLFPPHTPTLDELGQAIQRHNISILWLTAGLFHLMVKEQLEALRGVRQVLAGGDVLSPTLVRTLLESVDSGWLINGYGPTENTTFTCCHRMPRGYVVEQTVPVGKPIAHTQVYVLDSSLQQVPAGEAGELYAGGAGLARGYLNRPDLTAEKFVPNPFSDTPGARMYRTGDLARYREDGSLEFLGRIDQQVKIRGFRIEPGEIEAVLLQHPGVHAAIVIPQADGSGEKRLMAYVVEEQENKGIQEQSQEYSTDPSLSPAEAPSGSGAGTTRRVGGEGLASTLRAFLQDRLPDYMIPSAFMLLESLPLTPNGKVDRRALPSPESTRSDSDGGYIAPRTPVEAELAAIWCDVLGLSSVSVHDNFFMLGGHSLAASQIMTRVRRAFQVDLSLASLFNAPTLADLAAEVEQARQEQQAPELFSIPPAPRNVPLPLSFSQERIWFLNELAPGTIAYNAQVTARLRGMLDVAALERTLNEIVRRHEILRTTFEWRDDRPVQVIHPTLTVTLPLVDLCSHPAEQRESLAEQMIAEEFQHSFDVRKLPLARWTVLRLAPDDHLLVQVEHHFVHDGWSLAILLREIKAIYSAFIQNQPSPLPPLPIQYADFAYWQRHFLQERVLDGQLRYWKEQFVTLPPPLELPTDRPRPKVQTFNGAARRIELPPQLYKNLRDVSREQGVTLFMTLLAAFKVLLYRYSGQTDLAVGSAVANRRLRETEGLIGMIVNNVVMRAQVSGELPFNALLERVRDVTVGAYAHQDFPFDKLVEVLRPERDLSRNPLYQVSFSFHDSPVPDLDFAGLTGEIIVHHNASAKFDLNVTMIPRAEQRLGRAPSASDELLTVIWEYNTDLFDDATMSRMIRHFEHLLESICADPSQPIGALPMLSSSERRQLLIDWNAEVYPHGADSKLHELVEQQAARTPDALAVACNDRQITYHELNSRANQIAHRLIGLGLQPEGRVGVLLERSIESLVALLAILKAGGVYLPIDAAYPAERIRVMLEDSAAYAVLTSADLRSQVPTSVAHVLDLAQDEQIERETRENPGVRVEANQLAYLIYTSGSTGRPKGVGVAHGAAAQHCLIIRDLFELTEQDRVLQLSSLSFDASLEQILPAWFAGACLVLRGPDLWDPAEFGDVIQKLNLTVIQPPTAYWHQWVQMLAATPAPSIAHRLRLAMPGGDTMLPEVVKLWQQSPFGSARLLNAYGPTETVITPTIYQVPAALSATSSPQRISIGRPLPSVTAYILDRCGNPTPVGVSGELHIGGPMLARGYHRRPDLTAEKFVPDPFSSSPGGRLYRTGDLARYLPDGNIDFLGRVDHQIKIRGFRIELGEIEAVLRRHPAVQAAVVMVREVAATTGGYPDKRIVAYVVGKQRTENEEQESKGTTEQSASQNAGLSSAELRLFLQQHLPDYMLPNTIVFLEALPLTPNGKIDRLALPVPEQTRTEETAPVAPRTPDESAVLQIWQDLLGIGQIGIHDNFFVLGGHSLLITQLASRIRATFGVDLSLRSLFAAPTIADIAALIADRQIEQASADDLHQLLQGLKDLSPEEIQALLEVDS